MSNAWHRLTQWVLRPLRVVGRHLRRAAEQAAGLSAQSWDRHTTRVADDLAYRRTLTTAVSALATTLVPHPMLAAALAVWVTGSPDRRDGQRPGFTRFHDDEDDQPATWQPRPTLWNSFGD